MFARHSNFALLLLCCLACWLSCVIFFGEFPELLSLTDNSSNDFALRAASAEGVHVLSVANQGSIQIFARAAGQITAELSKSTVQDTSPTRSALFIVNSALRR